MVVSSRFSADEEDFYRLKGLGLIYLKRNHQGMLCGEPTELGIATIAQASEVTDTSVLTEVAKKGAVRKAVSTRSIRQSGSKRFSRSLGTLEAVKAVVEYRDSKGLTNPRLATQFGCSDRTVRSFIETGKMRTSTFEAMAESMGLSVEQLLRGEMPPTGNRSH